MDDKRKITMAMSYIRSVIRHVKDDGVLSCQLEYALDRLNKAREYFPDDFGKSYNINIFKYKYK